MSHHDADVIVVGAGNAAFCAALSAQEAEVYLNESYADGAAPVKARG